MTDHRPPADSADSADMRKDALGAEPDHRTNVNTPRWVKVFGAVAFVVVLLLVILLLAGGDHGPGRHISWPSIPEPPDALITVALGVPQDGLSP